MGSHNSDDPMDLGPFMQNYVLNNPFDLLKNPLEAHPEGSAAVPLQPSPAEGEASNGGSSRNSPALPARTQSEAPSLVITGKPGAVTLAAAAEENGTNFVVKDVSGLIMDTPKAHLGSNLAFAASLKNNLVSIGYVDVQDWLWNNYRHIPSYGAATLMSALLEHVQMYFPHITNIVLSRVMKFSFPDCNKFVNKQGAYYQSLVRRPDPQDYKDKSLGQAVEAVLAGRTTLSKAMASYAVEESRIIRMLVWEHNFMPPPSPGATSADSRRGNKKVADILGQNPEKANAGSRSTERSKGQGSSSSKKGCLGTLEPLTGVTISERHFSDIDSSDLDMEEWITDGSAPTSTASKRKASNPNSHSQRKSTRKRTRPSLDEDFEYALDTIIRSESEGGSEPEEGRRRGRRGRGKSRLRYLLDGDTQPQDLRVHADVGGEVSGSESVDDVVVKIETDDPGYGDTTASSEHSHHVTVSDETSQDSAASASHSNSRKAANTLSPTPTSSSSSSPNVKLSPSQQARSARTEPDTGTTAAGEGVCTQESPKAGDLVASTDTTQAELLEELEYMQEKLQGQKQKNSELLEEMGCARKEADALRAELCRRDLQFAILAKDFFELNGHFQKMTHKFKQYMSSALSRNEELGISNNNIGNLNGR